MQKIRSRNMVRPRANGTIPPSSYRTSQEDMLFMSGNHRMSKGEPDSSLWDFRWYDSLGTMEIAWQSRASEPLQTRILHLRSTLRQIAEICEPYQRNQITNEISRLCSGELEVLEWWLLK